MGKRVERRRKKAKARDERVSLTVARYVPRLLIRKVLRVHPPRALADVIRDPAALRVFDLHRHRERFSREALRVVDGSVGIGERHRLRADVDELLDKYVRGSESNCEQDSRKM